MSVDIRSSNMNGCSDDVCQERYGYSFTWKTHMVEQRVREINFGSFKLVLELQPKICQSMVYIFLYDKCQSIAIFDIKTYVLNDKGQKELEKLYKGSLTNGPTIWSIKRDELLKRDITLCESGRVKLGFEISASLETLDVQNSLSSEVFSFGSTTNSVENVFKAGNVKLEEKPLSSLEKMSLDFSKLLDNEEGSDLILKCVNRQIKAHRCILAARSDVFAAMFRSDMLESQKGAVAIENMDPETLQRMLRYIYSAKIEELTVETASELYKAVDQYGIELLKSSCASILKESLSFITACDVLLLADTHSDEQLEKSAVDFMVENWAFLRTDKWNKFCEEHPSLGNKVHREYAYKHAQCRTGEGKCKSFGALFTLGSQRATAYGYLWDIATNIFERERVKVEEKKRSFLEKISLEFGKLFDSELESDVVLKCVDRQIKAHRCILSARSDVFAAMLRNDMLEVVTIEDVAPETLERMVRYIYCGKVEKLTVQTASELYKATYEYEIESLKKHCVSFLEENLSQTSACDILLLANTYSNKKLENSAVSFMVRNCEIFCTDQWNKFCEEHPSLGNEVYRRYIFEHSRVAVA